MHTYIHTLVLHFSNQERATEVLLDAGADVNCRDRLENTATMVAAAVGHYEVLRLLANHPQVDLNAQVSCCCNQWRVYAVIYPCQCLSEVVKAFCGCLSYDTVDPQLHAMYGALQSHWGVR